MTRTYAAKRLLEHGPLTAPEFAEITGWGGHIAGSVLAHLLATGIVTVTRQIGVGRRIYRLAA